MIFLWLILCLAEYFWIACLWALWGFFLINLMLFLFFNMILYFFIRGLMIFIWELMEFQDMSLIFCLNLFIPHKYTWMPKFLGSLLYYILFFNQFNLFLHRRAFRTIWFIFSFPIFWFIWIFIWIRWLLSIWAGCIMRRSIWWKKRLIFLTNINIGIIDAVRLLTTITLRVVLEFLFNYLFIFFLFLMRLFMADLLQRWFLRS